MVRCSPLRVTRTIVRMAGAGLAAWLTVGIARPALAAWVVDDRGQCVEHWSPDSMLRGPTAILMSPTAPFRTGAGVYAYQSPSHGGWQAPGSFGFWGPVVAVGAGAAGVIDTVVWMGTGLVDTVTGGYFTVAPVKATRMSVDPLIPPFMSDSQRRAIEAQRPDPCGRVAASS